MDGFGNSYAASAGVSSPVFGVTSPTDPTVAANSYGLTSSGAFVVSYSTLRSGSRTLTFTLGGVAITNGSVTDSVGLGVVSLARSSLSANASTATAGSNLTLYVSGVDTFGNSYPFGSSDVPTGTFNFSLALKGSSLITSPALLVAGASTALSSGAVSPSAGVFVLTLRPLVAGALSVYATALGSTSYLSGSPLAITVGPGPISLSSCVVSGSGTTGAAVAALAPVTVVPYDAYGNIIPGYVSCGNFYLVLPDSSGAAQLTPASLFSDGQTCKMNYLASLEGTFTMKV